MEHVSIRSSDAVGKEFLSAEHLGPGDDEYALRNSQVSPPAPPWRELRAGEIADLVKNGNRADDWERILVTDEFHPQLVRNCDFHGLVRIGRLRDVVLEHHDLRLPAGLTNSRLISCDIGNDVAVHNVRYLAYVIVGDCSILFNVDEVNTTNHSKFGNGIVTDGEPEEVRVWIDLMNETGGRSILPFDGMICADAYLWAKYRDDAPLQERLRAMTQARFGSRRGHYGTIGEQCVIKDSRILKDVKIGPCCYIKGANKLKNLTINSSADEPSQIGEGVELVNGIIGYGCRIFYGCKAVRFVLGNNSSLKYGARLIHSYLGDNSTISCCEVLNNLIFPAHEQHHNNSFLVASVVMGQSNMAAGATIGSNHNSRANDSELQAGRGFWPGLCTSIKHPSRFASFVLLAKGDYPAELDIPLPFSLVNNNVHEDRLEVMPAYWWLFNMYALARNAWKYRNRDTRLHRVQHIEFDALAPDTADEIEAAMGLLEEWAGAVTLTSADARAAAGDRREATREAGRSALESGGLGGLTAVAPRLERSRRPVVVLKPCEGYAAYRQMLVHYAVQTLVPAAAEAGPGHGYETLDREARGWTGERWVNLGGQLAIERDVDELRAAIGAGELATWEAIHARYDALWERYPADRRRHAYATLCRLYRADRLSRGQWADALAQGVRIAELVRDRVLESRRKDYENPFRRLTFRNDAEMDATIGELSTNSFVVEVRARTEAFVRTVEELTRRP